MHERTRVLVVDDEPDVVLVCRVNLELTGFAVVEASGGGEALARMREHPPDVVLLEVVMQPMSGWDVLDALQDDPQLGHIPVVIMTARVGVHEQVTAWSLGAAAFLSKPFRFTSLGQFVQQVVTEDPAAREARRTRALRRLGASPDA